MWNLAKEDKKVLSIAEQSNGKRESSYVYTWYSCTVPWCGMLCCHTRRQDLANIATQQSNTHFPDAKNGKEDHGGNRQTNHRQMGQGSHQILLRTRKGRQCSQRNAVRKDQCACGPDEGNEQDKRCVVIVRSTYIIIYRVHVLLSICCNCYSYSIHCCVLLRGIW